MGGLPSRSARRSDSRDKKGGATLAALCRRVDSHPRRLAAENEYRALGRRPAAADHLHHSRGRQRVHGRPRSGAVRHRAFRPGHRLLRAAAGRHPRVREAAGFRAVAVPAPGGSADLGPVCRAGPLAPRAHRRPDREPAHHDRAQGPPRLRGGPRLPRHHRHRLLPVGRAPQRELAARRAFAAGDLQHRRPGLDDLRNRNRAARLPDHRRGAFRGAVHARGGAGRGPRAAAARCRAGQPGAARACRAAGRGRARAPETQRGAAGGASRRRIRSRTAVRRAERRTAGCFAPGTHNRAGAGVESRRDQVAERTRVRSTAQRDRRANRHRRRQRARPGVRGPRDLRHPSRLRGPRTRRDRAAAVLRRVGRPAGHLQQGWLLQAREPGHHRHPRLHGAGGARVPVPGHHSSGRPRRRVARHRTADAGPAYRPVRRPLPAQGRQLAHVVLAFAAARRAHVRDRARRHGFGARGARAARGEGAARDSRRRTHARARGIHRRSQTHRTPVPRARRTRHGRHHAHRRARKVPVREPGDHEHRRVSARRAHRPPRRRRRSSGRRGSGAEITVAGVRRTRANPSPGSGAAATRMATTSGSRESPPTCSTILPCAPW